MLVSDVAIAIACAAFLITQIHLWRVAKKLIKKSEDSWVLARTTIFESSKMIHDDVVTQIKAIDVTGLPMVIEDRFLKLQGGLRESFVAFGDSLEKTLDPILRVIPKSPAFAGNSQDAQAASVEARKINQVITTLEGGVMTGGDIVGAAQSLGEVMAELGEPSLQEWLVDHPKMIPKIYSIAMRHPRLAKQMQAFQQRFMGAPGDGGRGGQGSRGREV